MVDITKAGTAINVGEDDIVVLPVTAIGLIHHLHDGDPEQAMCGIAFNVEGYETPFMIPVPVDFFEEMLIELPELIRDAKAGTGRTKVMQ